MNSKTDYSKSDKRLIYVALIGALITLFFLIFDGGSFSRDRSNDIKVGKVTHISNDARQKVKGSFTWDSLESQQEVYIGDSVYSGANSNILVDLDKGGSVNVGENSMVTFDTFDKEQLLDLELGKFKLKVNGSMKVAMQGEIMTIKGSNSEIEVKISKNKKPEIKVVKGTPDINRKSPAINLDSRIEISTLKYNWKLYDDFLKVDNQLFPRPEAPTYVQITNKISWQKTAEMPAIIEWANNIKFNEKIRFQAPATSLDLNKAFVGENYWRISFDGQNWSKPNKFKLEAAYKAENTPNLEKTYYEIPFLGEPVKVGVPLSQIPDHLGYVAQASHNENFDAENTKTFWAPVKNPSVSFYHTGTFYYRFKSVNRNLELSNWSQMVRFNVFVPTAPPPPPIATDEIEGFVGDRITVSWNSAPSSTRFELFDEHNKRITRSKGNQLIWLAQSPGVFRARAYQVNKYGQQSPASKYVRVTIHPKELPLAQEKEPAPERKLAQEENKTRTKIERRAYDPIWNDNYKVSQFSVQGMLWTIQSTDQKYYGTTSPLATGLGLHTLLWKRSHGIELNLKTGVFGFNKAGENATALKAIEPRYHYRFIFGSPVSFLRELMISAFAGYELYRNSSPNFSSQYDLIKFGTSLEFPFGKRWATGGEFGYGHGLDASKKYEISGNLNYYYDPKFSIGVGYRLHLFDAGSLDSSATSFLPYREGYTEGFTMLNYFF